MKCLQIFIEKSFRFGKTYQTGTGIIFAGILIIALTHGQIARYMGSAREVVSRMLKYFASEGIVEVSRGGVTILDKKRLSQLTL